LRKVNTSEFTRAEEQRAEGASLLPQAVAEALPPQRFVHLRLPKY
jgi:hypothetical protein